ncbi:hypothetical protein F4604DRAFT_1687805 [Suillus subluteus]|nr:hypothetical protein F4604DRAFT_1687805 [Suillus subluteus]
MAQTFKLEGYGINLNLRIELAGDTNQRGDNKAPILLHWLEENYRARVLEIYAPPGIDTCSPHQIAWNTPSPNQSKDKLGAVVASGGHAPYYTVSDMTGRAPDCFRNITCGNLLFVDDPITEQGGTKDDLISQHVESELVND